MEVTQVKALLRVMHDISKEMPEIIWMQYFDGAQTEEKYVLTTCVDAFKSLELFCDGMSIVALPQCGMLLRLLIEQTAIIKMLVSNKEVLPRYVSHFKFREEINHEPKWKQIKLIAEKFNLPEAKPWALAYLDYGWLYDEPKKDNCKEEALLRAAGYEDCLSWKKQFLDKFAHQSFTLMNVMDPNSEFGNTMTEPFMNIVCKMFDELCCCFHQLVGFTFTFDGVSKFQKVFRPLYDKISFKGDSVKKA